MCLGAFDQVAVNRTNAFQSVLSEDVFREAIKDNYFHGHRFRYELSAEQVRRLQGLFWKHRRFGGLAKRGQQIPAPQPHQGGKRARLDSMGNQQRLNGDTTRSTRPWSNTLVAPRGANVGVGREKCPQPAASESVLLKESFFGAPVDPGDLAAGGESRTTIVLGPLPVNLTIAHLVSILEAQGLDRRYNFLFISQAAESRHRYCLLNMKDTAGVAKLVDQLLPKTWCGVSGHRFADDCAVEIGFSSLQGLDDLVLEFGDEAHWELENVAPRDSTVLADGVPVFFFERGAQQQQKVVAPENHGTGEEGANRAAHLKKLMGNVELDIRQHCLQPFDWQSIAGVKSEDGMGDSERIRATAMISFRQDLERVLMALEKQDRRITRALKLKYKPLQKLKDTDPNHPFYEESFRAISKEVDDRMGSTGANQGRRKSLGSGTVWEASGQT